MKHIYPLGLVVIAIMAIGCTRYSYPSSTAVPALSAQASLSSFSAAGVLNASSSAKVVGVQCVDGDYQVQVAYEHGFAKVTHQDIQYQIYPESSQDLRQVTRPTGVVSIDGLESKGDVTFVIPSDKFVEAESDVVVRLRIKSRQILEATSPYDIIHVSGGCK